MNRKVFLPALIALNILFFSVAADAAVLTWDADNTQPFNGIQDGDGTWTTGTNYWSDGFANVAWNDKDTAVFGTGAILGAGYTVTIAEGGVTAGGLTINYPKDSNDYYYTIQGGDLTFAADSGTPTITWTNANGTNPSLVINSNIHGGDILIDHGSSTINSGSIILGGTNDWTGNLQVTSPSDTTGLYLTIVSSTALSSVGGASVTIDPGSTLDITVSGTYSTPITINGFGASGNGAPTDRRAPLICTASTAAEITLTGPITLAGDSTMSSSNSTTQNHFTISGIIGDSGAGRSLYLNGFGIITLQGSNTYKGNTYLTNGTVNLDSASGAAVNKNGGDFYFNNLRNSTLNLYRDEQIADTATLYFTSTATTRTETFNLLGHTETVKGLSKDTEKTSGYVLIQNQGDSPASVGTLVLNTAGSDFSYNGTIRDSSVSDGSKGILALTKKGAGTQTLDGPDVLQFTGNLTVEEGILALGVNAPGTIGGSTNTIEVKSGATLDLSAQATPTLILNSGQTLQGGGSVTGNVTLNGGSNLMPGSSAGLLTVSGDLDLSAAVAVNMTWELAALSDNPSDAGTLYDQVSVGGNLALGGASTLNIDFNLLPADQRPDSSNVFWSSTHSWKIIDTTTNTGDTDFFNPVSFFVPRGYFTHAVDGGGDILLNFTPIVSSNLLWVGGAGGNKWDNDVTANWYQDSTPPLVNFQNYDNVTFNNSSSNQGVVIDGEVKPVAIVVSNDASHNYTFSGTGSFSASTLTKDGLGSLTVANSGPNTIINGLTLTQGTLIFQQDGSTEVSGNLTGAGSLQQNGSGSAILTLWGDNSGFTGPITVDGGTLKAGSTTALGDSATGTTVNGGTLDVGGQNLGDEHVFVQGGGAGGNGAIISSNSANQYFALKNVTITGTSLILGGDTGRWDVRDGTIDDNLTPGSSITLTKKGTGTVGFAYSDVTSKLGDINIEAGTLTFDGQSMMGDETKTITLAAGGALAFYEPTYEVKKPIISTGGTIESSSGTNTLSGPITLNAGSGDSTLQVTAGSLTVDHIIDGAAGLSKTGDGTLTLKTANTYGGGTTLRGGTLNLDSPSGYTILGNIKFDNLTEGTTSLNFYRDAQIEPTANVEFTTAGGANYFRLRGTTQTVAAIDLPATSSSQAVIGNNLTGTAGTLIVDGTVDCNYWGIVRDEAGTLALVKRGSSTFTLQGTKSGQYSGGLTVEEGKLDISNGVLPAAGLVTVTGSGTLDLGFSYQTVAAFQIDGGVLDGYGYLTNNTTNFDVQGGTVNATLDGSMGLVKTGSGTATLTNINTYYGPTEIRAGTLALTGSASINPSPAITLSGSATFDVSGLYSPYVLGSLTTQALGGAGTVQGPMALGYAGILQPGTPTTAGTLAFTNNLDLSNAAGGTLDFQLSSDGTGLVTPNDQITVASALTQPTSGTVLVAFHALDATLDTAHPYTLIYATGSFDCADPNLGRFSIVNNTRYQVTPTLVGGSGAPGGIQLAFSTDATHPGPKDLKWMDEVGFSRWVTNSETDKPWKDLANLSGPAEKFYEMDTVTFDDDSPYRNVDLSGPVYPLHVTIDNSESYPYAFFSYDGTGTISGATDVKKQGAGDLTLNNNNDFGGVFSITNGRVILGAARALGNTEGATEISGAGTLDLGDQVLPLGEVISISGTGFGGNGTVVNSGVNGTGVITNLVLADNATIGGDADWKVSGNPGGMVGGGFTLTKIGASTVTIENMGPTGLGNIVINEGRLELAGSTGIGSSTVTIDNVKAGEDPPGVAELSFNDSTAVHQKDLIVGTHGGTIVAKNGTAHFAGSPGTNSGLLNGDLNVNVSPDDTLILGHNLSGNGALRKDLAGTLELTGSNGYTGGTVLINGSLQLNSETGPAIPGNVEFNSASGIAPDLTANRNDQIAHSSVLTFTGYRGYLVTHGTTQTIKGISCLSTTTDKAAIIDNELADTAGTLIIDTAGENFQFRGMIRDGPSGNDNGTLALVKRGNGTLKIITSQAEIYTGGLTIEAGTLDLTEGVLPPCDYTISGGTLNIGDRSRSIGTFQITGGTVQADTSGTGGVLTSDATFDVQGGTVEAVLAGDQGLAKTGAAEAVLKADNSYTGNTTITQGTLTLAGQGQINASSPILNEATFRIADDVAAHTVSTISGSGTTQLGTDARLTAAGVKQGSLMIGAGAKLTIAPVAAGGGPAGAGGAAPVPEPGAWTLLLAGLLGVAAWRRLRRR
jgi:fibronectin-binding autotransporter adhesin